MERLWVCFGALAGFAMVAMAAFAAHGLQGADPATLAAVNSAILMQGFHAPALLFTGLWARRGGFLTHLSGLAFTAGIVLFCGSIYQKLIPLSWGVPHMPTLTPIGGMALMAGWLLLLVSVMRR